MSTVNREVLLRLENNPIDAYSEGVSIILRLLENIIREPENIKYRTIRTVNPIIKEKLLSLSDVWPVLQCLGFEQIGDELKLTSNMLIADLKKYRDFLKERLEASRNQLEAKKFVTEEPKIVPGPSNALQSKVNLVKQSETGAIKKRKKIDPIKPFYERIEFPRIIPFSNQFLRHLESSSDQVMQYEDDNLKAYGRNLIPIEMLAINAFAKMRQIQKSIISGQYNDGDPCFNDMLLVELANWFNTDFFTWINSLPCKRCGNENIQTKGGYVDNGIRVETYTCCNETSKFYRYNDIETILKTRRGRCGEYANCFTFLCRCLGYDARLVYATFDHVWTEVYSMAKKRWLHIDPSDNVIDAPLMYQYGWKRNIDYVVAFSRDDCQDVTWRYTNDHDALISRRTSCIEKELLETILLLRKKRQENCSAARKKYLARRSLFELIELMTPKAVTTNEKKGRSSGSLDWKLSRGEQNLSNFYVFNALPEESLRKQFNVRYSCAKNVYERFVVDGDHRISVIETGTSWESYHYISSNLFRKVEKDWKMVYLARLEDSTNATISWCFDFKHLRIKTISLKFESKTYESGVIQLKYLTNGSAFDNIESICGSSKFEINVALSGGKGDIAWQHTQLFRQRIGSTDYPFELKITFY